MRTLDSKTVALAGLKCGVEVKRISTGVNREQVKIDNKVYDNYSKAMDAVTAKYLKINRF